MPNQADREAAAQRLGLDVPPDSEHQRIEDAVTVARYLAETCMGGVGYTAKPNDFIPVASRIYAAALAAGTLSDAAASVRVEYEARDVQAERMQAEQAAERERQKQERAEQAALDAKAAILGGPLDGNK